MRWRNCNDQLGNPVHEIEITKVQSQEGYMCNCSVEDIMKGAIHEVLRYLPIDTTGFWLRNISVTLRTSKCWYVDSTDGFALKSCDTTHCYQTLYRLYYSTQYGMYLINHDSTEGNEQINPCQGYQHQCHDVLYSHNIPSGWLDGTPPCPDDCYWTVYGNDNVLNSSKFLGTLDNAPLVIKTHLSTKIIVNSDNNLFGFNDYGINSSVGIGTDFWGQKARSLLDVRGTISTGGVYSHDGQSFTQCDGVLSLYPSGNGGWYHFYNRDGWDLNISSGAWPGDFEYSDTLIGNQYRQGYADIATFSGYGKVVGIGCHPYKTNSFQIGTKTYPFGPAVLNAMLTVSDMKYPSYDNNSQSWTEWGGNNIILRVERRSVIGDPHDTTDYKLISAGHNTAETFMVHSNGTVRISNLNNEDVIVANPSGLVKIGSLNYNGNVPTQTVKLTVGGAIIGKEMVVTLSDWSDYIFNKNYNLTPLDKLEQYINKNKHLPDIPTATDIEANGIELGMMQAKLLKKIEELTLYVIKLKKEINQLKGRRKGR